ncbi:tRNA dihydrouridine synthase DusB [Nonomuraea sp. NPDC050663]|uniref:tRNA dihydrouridine synthase DusB n=1 Tax=Nonomuraea sp. NPDC050663 TaxID=3364370 RepID=UPI00379AFD4D
MSAPDWPRTWVTCPSDPGRSGRASRRRRSIGSSVAANNALGPGCATTVGVKIGPIGVWPPVVLAPMAGITNAAFRVICRDVQGAAAPVLKAAAPVEGVTAPVQGAASVQGMTVPVQDATLQAGGVAGPVDAAGLYVCEMITTRALVERNVKTMRMIRFAPGESPRSIQLYGVDPDTVGRAVKMIVDEDLADHIDLNFGCPVPKVTRRGGGSALPYKRNLLRRILRSAVANAGALPVTIKMRTGIDDDHLTYLDAGRIAQEEGVAAVALHARTARQHYGGTADWSHIARLKEAVTQIPVLGNGDIWCADDAMRMVAQTGCDGVVVGRGCLGRPWLFRDLQNAFNGSPERARPALGEVAEVMGRHLEALVGTLGSERSAVVDFRKHVGWYLKGFTVGAELRRELTSVESVDEFRRITNNLDQGQPWPPNTDTPRGKSGERSKVLLPEGWLDDPDDGVVSEESDVSGG